MVLLPSFSILFDSLLSTAQSRFWFSSFTSLLSSTYSCLCGGSLRCSPLLGNLHLHLPLKSLSAIVRISISLISLHGSPSLLLFSLSVFVSSPTDLALHKHSRPGEGVSSSFVTSSPGAPVVFIWSSAEVGRSGLTLITIYAPESVCVHCSRFIKGILIFPPLLCSYRGSLLKHTVAHPRRALSSLLFH